MSKDITGIHPNVTTSDIEDLVCKDGDWLSRKPALKIVSLIEGKIYLQLSKHNYNNMWSGLTKRCKM